MQSRTRGLRELCGLLGYSAQAYYQYDQHSEHRIFKEEELIQQVMAHRRLQPRLGARKLLVVMQQCMQQDGLAISRDAFFELLRDRGLLIRIKRRRVRTTFSAHRFRKYANLINGFTPERPNQLWVSDITYIRLQGENFAYLSLVTDAYSRKIIGFCVSHDLSAASCIKALQMALAQRTGDLPLIHHSDRGTQYCSRGYTKLLQRKDILISMTQSGNPRDNAIAERVNGILKQEYLTEIYRDVKQARLAVSSIIPVYNGSRPHTSLDMMTPDQAHQTAGHIKRKWKNYYMTNERKEGVTNEIY
jgi:transposase InsO family protein